MFLSVIIPTYNRADLVLQTVQSVLEQDFDDFEVIVVDDGSTDNTEEVLTAAFDKHNFRYLRQENQGRSTARNYGLAEASGDYVMFLDSDDLLAPRALQVLSEAARKHSESSVIAGGRLYIDEENRFLDLDDKLAIEMEFFDRELVWEKVKTIYFCMGSYVVKTELARRLDGFKAAIEPVEDFDFFIRFCDYSKISAVKTPVVYIRQHLNNTPSIKLFKSLMKLAQQNFELLESNPNNYSPQMLKKIRAEWQLKMANDFYAFDENSKAFKHYLAAIRIEPKLIFDRGVVKATLMTNFSSGLRKKLRTGFDFRKR